MPTIRRLGVVLLFVIVAWCCVCYVPTMIVNPPRGEAILTADQQSRFNTDSASDAVRQFDAAAASFNAWHHCESVDEWLHDKPDTMPARMVTHAANSERFIISAWSMSVASGQYVSGLCA